MFAFKKRILAITLALFLVFAVIPAASASPAATFGTMDSPVVELAEGIEFGFIPDAMVGSLTQPTYRILAAKMIAMLADTLYGKCIDAIAAEKGFDMVGTFADNNDKIEELLGVVDPLMPYDSARLYRDVETLANYYPQILTLASIGETVLGNDIPLLIIGRGSRPILWIGAIHAREAVTCAYLMLLAEEYTNAYCGATGYGNYSAARVQQLLDEFTIYIVPMANPDGVDIVTANGPSNVRVDNVVTWRNNAEGVDLNRNFPFYWETANANATAENRLYYRGASAGSEPETRALMNLCDSVSFEHLLSCHTAGQVVIWRDNGNGAIPGDEDLAWTISQTMGYPMQAPTASGWGGGFENWFRNEYQRPGICLEFARMNTARPQDIARFYTDDMVSWDTSKNLLLAVLDSISLN